MGCRGPPPSLRNHLLSFLSDTGSDLQSLEEQETKGLGARKCGVEVRGPLERKPGDRSCAEFYQLLRHSCRNQGRHGPRQSGVGHRDPGSMQSCASAAQHSNHTDSKTWNSWVSGYEEAGCFLSLSERVNRDQRGSPGFQA